MGCGTVSYTHLDVYKRQVRGGVTVLVIYDRAITPDTLPIPALLAVGAVHHLLVRDGLRCEANLIIETATARDPHHFAVLLGYGATLILSLIHI